VSKQKTGKFYVKKLGRVKREKKRLRTPDLNGVAGATHSFTGRKG